MWTLVASSIVAAFLAAYAVILASYGDTGLAASCVGASVFLVASIAANAHRYH